MIRIDEEFRRLIPPLAEEEYRGLEASLIAEGCRDALVLWGDILIDGHNRYEICHKRGITFEIAQLEFEGRDDVKLWIMRNQLARRNLTDFQRIEITHRCEDAVRAKAKERQIRKPADFVVENLPPQNKARDELGKLAGVSGKTYDNAVKVLEQAPEPVIQATRQNELSINAAYQVTRMEPEEQQEVARRIEQGEAPREVVNDVQKRPHVSFNSGYNEWYTPPEYIELARAVMGSVDCDPASSDAANETVKAKTYYTAETNGLDKEWRGNVWMNPPYAGELIGQFVDRFVEQIDGITQAIVLVNNATETEWFHKLVSRAAAVCFPRGRIRFLAPNGEPGAPLQGQALLYFGDARDKFIEAFASKGWCAALC